MPDPQLIKTDEHGTEWVLRKDYAALEAERDRLAGIIKGLEAAWDACEFHGSNEEAELDQLFAEAAATKANRQL